MSEALAGILVALIQVMTFAIIARALLSWFPQSAGNPIANFLFTITEPVIAPIRRILPRFGMIDLSPIVAIILLQVIGAIVAGQF